MNKNFKYSITKDSKGNVIRDSKKMSSNANYGFAGNNQFANDQRIINTQYNKFGQVTSKRDITIKVFPEKQKVTIFRDENGTLSKTFWNTQTGAKHTITCSE